MHSFRTIEAVRLVTAGMMTIALALLTAGYATGQQPALTVQSADLPNGITLPYVEQGDPAGLPVLLLHGVTDSWRSFELVLPHLPSEYRVIAITQRGHGDATRPESGYRFADFANDVRLFLDLKEIDRAVVVGHSMGTGVAQRFAIDHPNRVAGLVLIGAFARWKDNPAANELWETVIKDMTDPVDPSFVLEFQLSTTAQPVPPEFFEMCVYESLKLPAHVWRGAFGGFRQTDHAPELPKISAPTLILWGDQDAICPRGDQDLLATAIPNTRLIVYEGTGHSPPWETPQRVAEDLTTFLADLPK